MTQLRAHLADVATIGSESLADVSQPTEQVARGRKVRRHLREQAQRLSANRRPVIPLIRIQKQSDVRAQPIVILPCTQFSPTRQILLTVYGTRVRRPASMAAPALRIEAGETRFAYRDFGADSLSSFVLTLGSPHAKTRMLKTSQGTQARVTSDRL